MIARFSQKFVIHKQTMSLICLQQIVGFNLGRLKMRVLQFLHLCLRYKNIIKFYKPAMLPKHQQKAKMDPCVPCNCNVFDSTEPKEQNSEIFLTKNRSDNFFQSQTYSYNAKTFLGRKEKLSLRRNQQKKLKENMSVLNLVGQQELLYKTCGKTDLMTRADSHIFRTINEYPQQNQFSCYSSYVFKQIIPNEHLGNFGRFIQFNKNDEIKNNKQKTRSRCKSIPEINAQNSPGISDRERKENSNLPISKEQILGETKRNAKSQTGGETMKIYNFHSQPDLKKQPYGTNSRERPGTSIIFNFTNLKNQKKTPLLESLKFKDTESINDGDSSLFSEVISEQSENADKGQFSQIVKPKLGWRRNTAFPKLSKFK